MYIDLDYFKQIQCTDFEPLASVSDLLPGMRDCQPGCRRAPMRDLDMITTRSAVERNSPRSCLTVLRDDTPDDAPPTGWPKQVSIPHA